MRTEASNLRQELITIKDEKTIIEKKLTDSNDSSSDLNAKIQNLVRTQLKLINIKKIEFIFETKGNIQRRI